MNLHDFGAPACIKSGFWNNVCLYEFLPCCCLSNWMDVIHMQYLTVYQRSVPDEYEIKDPSHGPSKIFLKYNSNDFDQISVSSDTISLNTAA
jgi:hypothetical protein